MTEQALQQVVQAAFAASRLPSAPTLDWCDQAASILLPLTQGPFVVVALCDLGPQFIVTHVHATGRADARRVAPPRGMALIPSLRGRPWYPGVRAPCDGQVVESAESPEFLADPHGRVFVAAFPMGNGSSRHLLVWAPTALAAITPDQQAALRVVAHLVAEAAARIVGIHRAIVPWLSQRESEVLHFLTRGASVQQISQQLFRSPHTVQDYVKNLHRKLNASSRGELIAIAMGNTTQACGTKIVEGALPPATDIVP